MFSNELLFKVGIYKHEYKIQISIIAFFLIDNVSFPSDMNIKGFEVVLTQTRTIPIWWDNCDVF